MADKLKSFPSVSLRMSIDKLFWMWFALSGLTIAFFIFNETLSMFNGILLVLVVFGIGLAKISQEMADREIINVNSKIVDTLHWVQQGLEKLTNPQQNKNEEQHELLAKKIIELENRLSEISRALTAEIVDLKSKEVELVEIEQGKD